MTYERNPLAPAPLTGSAMDKEEIVDVLNDLLDISRTRRSAFVACAQDIQTLPECKAVLLSSAQDCAKAEVKLVAMVRSFGFEPTRSGTPDSVQARDVARKNGRTDVNSDGSIDATMLQACERGEDAALARCRQALEEQLPTQVRDLVAQLCETVKRDHDTIRGWRDAACRHQP